jgi:amicoumacin kinase
MSIAEVIEMPLVSIIMPSYNHEAFITHAIESILNQGFDDWELIIIDDASSDKSPLIIRDYAAKDRRIRIELHKENLGIARTVNQGIQMACGKYIAFLASDDLWRVDKLEKQLKILDTDENLVVWSEGEIIDEHSNPTGMKFTEYYGPKIKIKSGNILDTLLLDNYIFGSSYIIKAENIKGISFNEDLKYLNDYQFVIDLATKYNFCFFDEPLASYRFHSGGTAHRDRENWIADDIKIRTYIMQNFAGQINVDILKHNYSRTLDLFNERIIELSAQNTVLSSQIVEMRQSILWQLIMIYQNGFVERFLPVESKRRKGYDLCIKGARVLANEGASKFCAKLYNFIVTSLYKNFPKKLSLIIPIDRKLGEKLSKLEALSLWDIRYVEFILLNCTDELQVSDKFKIATNEKGMNFAEALNIAIKASSGKYILIVNNDKVLGGNDLTYLLNYITRILAGVHLFRIPCGVPEKEIVSYDHIASYAYNLNDISVDKEYCLKQSDQVLLKKKWIDSLGGFDDQFKTTQYIKNNLKLLANDINYKDDVLNEASRRFNSEPSTLKCLKRSLNSVYECRINGADKILRILRRSRDWLPLVKGEIDWINYLSNNDVPVCRAILSTSGNYVEVIERPNDLFLVSAFAEAGGHTIDLSNNYEWNDALFKKWGSIMGRMHYLSKDYDVSDPTTKRRDWNYEFIFDPQFDLGADNEKILRIWQELVEELNSLPKNNDSYGLVHNDFHHFNFKYDGSKITVIDFDDCTYNWYVADIAISLYHAVMNASENERNEFAKRFMRNFFAGYYSENKLDDYWIDLLPKFIQLRHIYCYIFYQQNWNHTTLTSKQREHISAMKSSIESERPLINLNLKDIWKEIVFGDQRCK